VAKPYTLRTNGKAEQFLQASLKEWAYKQAYKSTGERGRLLSFLFL
jgi:hypothetical protein